VAVVLLGLVEERVRGRVPGLGLGRELGAELGLGLVVELGQEPGLGRVLVVVPGSGRRFGRELVFVLGPALLLVARQLGGWCTRYWELAEKQALFVFLWILGE
jgi:hypothetical protein